MHISIKRAVSFWPFLKMVYQFAPENPVFTCVNRWEVIGWLWKKIHKRLKKNQRQNPEKHPDVCLKNISFNPARDVSWLLVRLYFWTLSTSISACEDVNMPWTCVSGSCVWPQSSINHRYWITAPSPASKWKEGLFARTRLGDEQGQN